MRLAVEGLTCIRGARSLFRSLSFGLGEGEAIVVTGPNGAGKTSLLRLVAGLLTPAGGRVVVEDSVQMANELSHFIGHLEAVKGALTVGENLDFGRKLLGGGGIEIDAALKKLGIGSLIDVPAQILSAGQKRRLALARLLVATRPLWLLDEPTTALDSEGQRTVIQLIGEHRASGGLVIVATHMALDLSDAREIVLTGEGVA